MTPAFDTEGSSLDVLWEDGERIFCKTQLDDADGNFQSVIVVLPATEHSAANIDRLRREYELKDQLDSSWAVRPLGLVHDAGRTMLMLEDTGGEPLNGMREIVINSRRVEDDQVFLSISDTGKGFPTELAEQIFDSFFTTKPRGTGMGLRICRSIVASHGGRVWAVGEPGRGATFHLCLPIA